MARLTPLRYLRRQLVRLDVKIEGYLRPFREAETKIQEMLFEAFMQEKLWQLKERRRENAQARAVLREVFKEADQAAQDLVHEHFALGQNLVSQLSRRRILETQAQSAARRILEDNLSGSIKDAEQMIGRRVDDVFRKEGLRQALAHGLEGQVSAASAAMRRNLQKQGITAFVDRAGRQWTLSRYVDVAVNTVSIEALNTATRLVLVEQDFDVVQINSVTDPCKLCVPFDGKEFSLTGRAADLPVLKEFPPFHGGCRHFMYPNQRTLQEQVDRLEVA